MNALAALVTGRRSRWAVIGFWVVLAAVAMPLSMKLPDVTKDSLADFIPADSQSRQLGEIRDSRFEGGNQSIVVLVYQREGGLLPSDETAIVDQARQAFSVERASPGLVPFGPGASPELVSAVGDTAIVVFPVDQMEQREARHVIEALRAITAQSPDGLDAYVTGMSALEIDNTIAREESELALFGVTVALVLILLIAVYRSPIVALAPLFAVGLAYVVVGGVLYLLAKAGMAVTGPSQQLLLVLMFGATTDYCLLLVSRYAEDVRHTEHAPAAMRTAVRRVAPSVIASAATTILALLSLVLASVGLVSGLGPVNAVGLGIGLVAALTLLPAIISVLGRRGFWPKQARVAFVGDAPEAASARDSAWRRVGSWVMARPLRALLIVLLLFVIGALGLTQLTTSGNIRADIKRDTDATLGFDVVADRFPVGVLGPAMVLIERADGQVTEADVAAATARLATIPDIGLITPPMGAATDGSAVIFNVIFPDEPFGNPAIERVGEMREALADLGGGLRGIVGGAAGEAADYRIGIDDDFRTLIPIVLGVVFIVMIALLRSVVSPLYILLSTLASFFSILGISVLIGRAVFGDSDFNSVYPVFSFVFLVALGVDYNIFVMDRIREETVFHGTREGTLRALVATGPVITSAGLILAGTFAALVTVPTRPLQMLGLTVALGVLLDTFVVRALFIPAMISLLGDRNWWPSRPARHAAEPPSRPMTSRLHAVPVSSRAFHSVELGSGSGAVAVVGDIALFVPDGSAADDLVDLARDAVATASPAGRMFARRIASALAADDSNRIPAFGAVARDDNGLAVLLYGNVDASFVDAGGAPQHLSGAQSMTWLDRLLPPDVGAVLIAPLGITPTGASAATLESGVVPGGWLRVVPGARAAGPPGAGLASSPGAPPPSPSPLPSPPRAASAAPAVAPQQALGTLVFDDGTRLDIDADYVVGREPAIDPRVTDGSARPFVLDDPAGTVSRVHAEIRREGLAVRLVDRGSTNGTHVPGASNSTWARLSPDEPVTLQPGDRGAIGNRTFVYERAGTRPAADAVAHRSAETVAVGRVAGDLTGANGEVYRLDRAYVVGRDPTSHPSVQRGEAMPIVILGDPHVSRVHARISVVAGKAYVSDAGTAAGTFVSPTGDGEWTRVGPNPCELLPGWTLRIGDHPFAFRADGS